MALVDQQSSFSMRLADKETQWSGQYDDLFDQYLNTSNFDFGTSHSNHGIPSDFGDLFEDPSALHRRGSIDIASPAPQGPEVSKFAKLCGRAATSDNDSFLLEELYYSREASPQSAASSPSLPRSTNGRRSSKSATQLAESRRSSSAGVRKPYRKLTTSPVMAQPTISRCASQDLWAQRVAMTAEKFNLPLQFQSGPISPPPSARPSQWDDQNIFPMAGFESQHSQSSQSLITQPHGMFNHQLTSQFTPLASPVEEHFYDVHEQATYLPHSDSAADSPYFSDAFSPHALSSYTSPTLEQELACQELQSGAISPFSFGASPQFDGTKVQPWWPPAATQPCEPTAYAYSRQVSAIHSSLSSESRFGSNAGGDDSFGANGLMIQCGPAQTSHVTYGNTPAHAQVPNSFESKPYGQLTPPKRLRKQRSTIERSPSPSSPTSRSRRTSRGHRRNKTATSGSRPVSAGFVNFTPDERDQILTGVAPSGSSKTKARREKEAADRRRRLSQAAAKAVMDAGGDISALAREGLLD